MGLVTSLMGKRVYLDTNVFIYALNGFPPYVPLLTELFDAIGAGSLVAIASELALAELLVIPFRHADASEEQRCRAIFRASPGVELQPVSIAVLEGVARLRAALSTVRTPDAIHIATAQLAGCDFFVTNDAHLRAVGELPVVLLSALSASAQKARYPAEDAGRRSLKAVLRTADSRLKFRFDAVMADLRTWWERWAQEDRDAFKKWVGNLARVQREMPTVPPYVSVRLEFAEEAGEGECRVFTPPIQAITRAIDHWERGEPYAPTSLGEVSP